ncbi:MAG TPA: DNA N-6-adenine-methyltransferase [Pseudolabrys sp.]
MTHNLTRSRGGSVAKYDPEKGIKTIAVLEGIEKYYARAKDIKQLEKAIREKLKAQAEFVVWWDTGGPGVNHGGNRRRPSSKSKIGDFEPEDWKRIVHRWRTKLNDPDKFEATCEAAIARYPKILEFDTTAHVGQNTGETEWFTPADYIEAARRVLGAIDLDPASTSAANKIIQATTIYTAADSGLSKDWSGRVWMNPPYAQPLIEHFAEKLSASVQAGSVTAAIALVNNATETAWFRALAKVASSVCFPEGRIRFWHPKKETATPLQGQAVLYFGIEVGLFQREFATFGVVWMKP